MQNFLYRTAIRFEQAKTARTYLMIAEVEPNVIRVCAYFALSFTEIEISELAQLSKSEGKRVDGISKQPETIKAFLLGQVGKDDDYHCGLSLESLLDEVLILAQQAQSIVGGRVLLLECADSSALQARYESVGFKYLQKANSGLNQMYRVF